MKKSYQDTSMISDKAVEKIYRLVTLSAKEDSSDSSLQKAFISIIKDQRLLVTFCKLQDTQNEVLRETMGIPFVSMIGAFIKQFPVVYDVATDKDFLLDLMRYYSPFNPKGSGVVSSFEMQIKLQDSRIGFHKQFDGFYFYVSITRGIQRPQGFEEETFKLILRFLRVFQAMYRGNPFMLLKTNLPKSWEKKAKKASRRALQPDAGFVLQTS